MYLGVSVERLTGCSTMVLLAYRGTPGLCAVRKRGGGKGGKEGVRREKGSRGKREERRGEGDDEGEGKETMKERERRR